MSTCDMLPSYVEQRFGQIFREVWTHLNACSCMDDLWFDHTALEQFCPKYCSTHTWNMTHALPARFNQVINTFTYVQQASSSVAGIINVPGQCGRAITLSTAAESTKWHLCLETCTKRRSHLLYRSYEAQTARGVGEDRYRQELSCCDWA